MGSFTNRDILNFAVELSLKTAKSLAKAGIVETIQDNVGVMKDKVVDTVGDLQETVNMEIGFVRLCLSVKPGFEKLVADGVDPLRAFKRAVRETKFKSNKNNKGGDQ